MAVEASQAINNQQALVSKILNSSKPLDNKEINRLAKEANLSDKEILKLQEILKQLTTKSKKGIEALDGHAETAHSWS